MSRWFSLTADIPYWAESIEPSALKDVCAKATGHDGDPLVSVRCATCRDNPETLSHSEDMNIAPPFPDPNYKTAIESILVAIDRPVAHVCTLRAGQKSYFGRAVNMRREFHMLFPRLPAPPSDLPAEIPLVAAILGNAVLRIPDSFPGCAKFRATYRRGAPCPFKESTRRLRDFAMTLRDCDLRQSRDIASDRCPSELRRSRGKLHMVVRGRRIDWREERREVSRSLQSRRICDISQFGRAQYTVRIELPAAHSTPSASSYQPQELKGIRADCRISNGDPVLSIANYISGVYTSPLGLMGGGRGAVVAISQGRSRPHPALPDRGAIDIPG